MAGGKTYYIDANKPHSVVNESEKDRVHLVLDLKVNEWLMAIFLEIGYQEIKLKYGSNSINDSNIDDIIINLEQIASEGALEIAQKLKQIKGE